MASSHYNIVVVIMMLGFIHINAAPRPVLPPGLHVAGLQAVEQRIAYNRWRRQLANGLLSACVKPATSGCRSLYLDGSFVTEKPKPGDFDACWDPVGVDRQRSYPAFLDISNRRARQKKRFGGEYFPSTTKADVLGRT